jgi:ABC-type uncharacterized transport system ATPase subunit
MCWKVWLEGNQDIFQQMTTHPKMVVANAKEFLAELSSIPTQELDKEELQWFDQFQLRYSSSHLKYRQVSSQSCQQLLLTPKEFQ